MSRSGLEGLTKEDLIVFDASALINVAASGYCSSFFEILPAQCVAEGIVFGEISNDLDKYPLNRNIGCAVDSEVLSIVDMDTNEASSFLGLVASGTSNDLDQGEAATIAVGSHRNAIAIIDERKGTRIALGQEPPVKVLSTLDLFKFIESTDAKTIDVNAALFNSLTQARMRVPRIHEDWVVSRLTPDQIGHCRSLRKAVREKYSTNMLGRYVN